MTRLAVSAVTWRERKPKSMNFCRLTAKAPAGLALGGVTGVGGGGDKAGLEAAGAVRGTAGGFEGLTGETAVAEHVEAAVPARREIDFDVQVGLHEQVDAAVFGRAVGGGDDGGRVDGEFVAGESNEAGAGGARLGSGGGRFVVAELNASAALGEQRGDKEQGGCGEADRCEHERRLYKSFCPIAICHSHKHEIYLCPVINHLQVIHTLYSETFMLKSNQVESCANHSATPTVFILARIR